MSTYKNCYKAIKRINEETLPNMGYEWNTFVAYVKNTVVEFDNNNLNRARGVTNAAKSKSEESYGFGVDENNKAAGKINKLRSYDGYLEKGGKMLNSALIQRKNSYAQQSLKFQRKNEELISTLKTNSMSSEELITQIINLGKQIQEYTNQELSLYKNEISNFLNKINSVTPEIYHLEKSINNQDRSLLNVRYKQWIIVDDEFFDRTGAFNDVDFDSKGKEVNE